MSPRDSEDQDAKEAARASRRMMMSSNSATNSSPGAVAVAASRKPSPRDHQIAEKNGQSLSDPQEGLSLAPGEFSSSNKYKEDEESKPPAELTQFQADMAAKQRAGRKSPPSTMPGAVTSSSTMEDSPVSPPGAFPFEIPALTTEELFAEKEAAKQHARRSPAAFSKPGAVAATGHMDLAAKDKATQLGLSVAPGLPDVAGQQADHPESSLVKEKSRFGLSDTPTRRTAEKSDGMSILSKARSAKHVDSYRGGDALPEQAPPMMKGTGMIETVGGPELESVMYDPEANSGGLAVAMPVEEGEEDSYIANAIEFDPDAKPVSDRRRRRFRFYALLGVFALLAAAAGAVVGVMLSDSERNADKSTIPYRETLGIQDRVERLIGAENLEDPKSPYSKALAWITHNDTMQLVPDSPNFVQRYILAYFYYGTTEKGPWKSCNPPLPGENYNCTYHRLRNLEPETYTTEEGKGRWLSSLHECSWVTVSCDTKQVVRDLWLIAQKLSGPFPEGLKHLQFLQSLYLTWNGLHGKLPKDFIQSLIYLTDIELQFNNLIGSIPHEWLGDEQMLRINLGNNKLNGTISSNIGAMKNLRALYLQGNQLSGRIPSSIGRMSSLTFLYLDTNFLTGPIPTELGNLGALDLFFIQKNLLTGSLPVEMNKLSKLTEVRFHRNKALGGAIPDFLFELPSLNDVDLRYCNFSGTLSSNIGKMINLEQLRLAYNPLMYGPLPTELFNLTSVKDIRIQGTSITGEIPSELCTPNESGDFIAIEADCKVTGTAESEITCSCCSSCCDPDGLDCSTPVP